MNSKTYTQAVTDYAIAAHSAHRARTNGKLGASERTLDTRWFDAFGNDFHWCGLHQRIFSTMNKTAPTAANVDGCVCPIREEADLSEQLIAPTSKSLQDAFSKWQDAYDQLAKSKAAQGIGSTNSNQLYFAQYNTWFKFTSLIWKFANLRRKQIHDGVGDDSKEWTKAHTQVFYEYLKNSRDRTSKRADLSMYCSMHQNVGDFLPVKGAARYHECGICVKQANVTAEAQARREKDLLKKQESGQAYMIKDDSKGLEEFMASFTMSNNKLIKPVAKPTVPTPFNNGLSSSSSSYVNTPSSYISSSSVNNPNTQQSLLTDSSSNKSSYKKRTLPDF